MVTKSLSFYERTRDRLEKKINEKAAEFERKYAGYLPIFQHKFKRWIEEYLDRVLENVLENGFDNQLSLEDEIKSKVEEESELIEFFGAIDQMHGELPPLEATLEEFAHLVEPTA
ncbi:hypothetical protein [Baaleninema sp.]|uniref:hypothetical protein n=1 Tax=Baaleninema sp. TaxID=3101197 RepID=UPI003D03C944